MIESRQLDEMIIQLESNPKQVDKILDSIQQNQPLLLDILVGTHAELLTESEIEYLLFLVIALYATYQKRGEVKIFSEQEIMAAEEASWKIINDHNDYNQAIEVFFDEVKETEVMDFIDLSIAPDDENEIPITNPGRLILLAVLTALAKLLNDQDQMDKIHEN